MSAKPPAAIDQKRIRHGALAVGGVALIGALAAAFMNGDPRPPPPQDAPTIAGPAPAAPSAETPAPEGEPLFETAGADAAPPPSDVSFVVRFEATHELGRAQALAAQGRDAEARRRAEAALRSRADLRGLCFDRFTLGGAEIVLRPCAGAPSASQQTWLLRLRGLPGVDYADANLQAQPDARTP